MRRLGAALFSYPFGEPLRSRFDSVNLSNTDAEDSPPREPQNGYGVLSPPLFGDPSGPSVNLRLGLAMCGR